MKRSIVVLCLGLLGCSRFWESPPPDWISDPPAEITVIWDKPVSNSEVEQTTWTTTNRADVVAISGLVDTQSWESSSILTRSHPTRILLMTGVGEKWEIHLVSNPDKLSIFNIGDPGRSGRISAQTGLVDALTRMIATATGQPIDLRTDFSKDIYNGKVVRRIPDATRKQLVRFFYPSPHFLKGKGQLIENVSSSSNSSPRQEDQWSR